MGYSLKSVDDDALGHLNHALSPEVEYGDTIFIGNIGDMDAVTSFKFKLCNARHYLTSTGYPGANRLLIRVGRDNDNNPGIFILKRNRNTSQGYLKKSDGTIKKFSVASQEREHAIRDMWDNGVSLKAILDTFNHQITSAEVELLKELYPEDAASGTITMECSSNVPL